MHLRLPKTLPDTLPAILFNTSNTPLTVHNLHPTYCKSSGNYAAQEIILQRTPARIDADFGAMNLEDAREVRQADTKHCVDFWSALPAAHGGVHSRFNHFYGSMAFGFVHLAAADSKWREVPEQVGRASHKRAVLAPAAVSAMFRTKLLGDANMQQINRLYVVTCV